MELSCTSTTSSSDTTGAGFLEAGPWRVGALLPAQRLPRRACRRGPTASQVKFDSAPSAMASKPFQNEELQHVSEFHPGRLYEVELQANTTAPYGDKFDVLIRVRMLAELGAGTKHHHHHHHKTHSSVLHVTFFAKWSPAMNSMMKAMISKAIEGEGSEPEGVRVTCRRAHLGAAFCSLGSWPLGRRLETRWRCRSGGGGRGWQRTSWQVPALLLCPSARSEAERRASRGRSWEGAACDVCALRCRVARRRRRAWVVQDDAAVPRGLARRGGRARRAGGAGRRRRGGGRGGGRAA